MTIFRVIGSALLAASALAAIASPAVALEVPVTPSPTTVQAGIGDEFGVTFTFGGDDLGEMPSALFVNGERWGEVTNTVSTNFVSWEQLKPCADITLTYRVYDGEYFEVTLGSDPVFADTYVGSADVLFKGDPGFVGCDPTWGVGSLDPTEPIVEEPTPALAHTGAGPATPLFALGLGASALGIGLVLVTRIKRSVRRLL